jgi:type IV secretion system protein TrbL
MKKPDRLPGWILALVLLALPGVAMAATGFQSPDAIIKSAFASNIGAIYNAAEDLFFGLVGIEVVWFTASMVLNQREMTYIIQQLIYKIITLGLYFKFLQGAADGFSYGNWFYALIHGMAGLGESLGGGTAVGDPSSILNQGLHDAAQLLGAPAEAFRKNSSWWDVFGDAAAGISALILTIEVLPVVLFILAAYALMALRVFMIDVEMYFILTAGILLLGAGGSRWTSSYARNYINYSVSVGIRFFTIYFILGVCNTFVNQQSQALGTLIKQIASGSSVPDMLQQLYSFGADFFAIALLILMVPKFAANLASGQSTSGVGDLLKPAAGAAAALGSIFVVAA